MTLTEQFYIALSASALDLPGPELLPERLARACAHVLPVEGAGISLFFLSDRRVPLGASDPTSAEAERLQFTVGEGPCISAHAEDLPVVADEATIRSRWPGYHDQLVTRTPIRGVISVPLHGTFHSIGALDLYLTPPRHVDFLSLSDALTVSTEIARCLQAQDDRSSDGPAWLDAPAAERRATVWQALGFLNAALNLDSPDALALLRARAYADDLTVDDLAEQLLDRQIEVEDLALDPDRAR